MSNHPSAGMPRASFALRLGALAVVMTASPAGAQTSDVIAGLDERSKHYADVARQIWDWAEVGYREE